MTGEAVLEPQEAYEKIEEAHQKHNKRAALIIIVLAALLAISEMAGKHAQTASIAYNIETNDLWAFYQAKTIRSTVLRTAVESAQLLPPAGAPDLAEARTKQLAEWRKTADRYETDPASKEGRKELAARAKATTELRDHKLVAYHEFEYSSGAFQLAIVMASAAIITEVVLLEIVSAAFGLVGLAFALVGWLAPMLIEL
jgi:uncharacterized protein DUF4337